MTETGLSQTSCEIWCFNEESCRFWAYDEPWAVEPDGRCTLMQAFSGKLDGQRSVSGQKHCNLDHGRSGNRCFLAIQRALQHVFINVMKRLMNILIEEN